MKINFNNNMHFNAHKLDFKPKVVKRDDTTGKYEPEEVSMVEIDLQNSKDLEALHKLKEEWYDANLKYVFTPYNTLNYTKWIVDGAIDDSKKTNKSGRDSKYFAVTTQEENFESLDPEKILSICNMTTFSEDYTELFLIQSKSKLPSERNSVYKRCGSALSDGLKHYYKQITVFPVEEAKPFYIANDFKPSETDENHLVWKREE